MSSLKILTATLLLLAALAAHGQTTPKKASFRASTASLSMGQGLAQSTAFGPIQLHFTSTDGFPRFPLSQNIGGSPYFSRELRYFPGVNLPFQADYVLISSVGAFEYGTIGLNLLVGDGNLDLIPDLLQREFSATGGFNGQAAADAPASGLYTVGGFLTRDAGRQQGTYSINLNGTSAGRLTFTGPFSLVTWQGSLDYQRGPSLNTAFLDLSQIKPDGSTNAYSGSASFSVENLNQLTFQPFTLTNAIGQILQARGMIMNRNGTRYIGGLELADGDPLTDWQDFSNLYVEIADSNDANSDGIPDLSSAYDPPAFITQHPASIDLPVGSTASFSVAFETVSSARVQWSLNGVDLPGATSTLLVLQNVQLSQSGVYAVRIFNRGGVVSSSNAVLNVLVPPTLLTQPVAVVADEGSTALFSIAASGSLPISYQWRLNGTNIALANTPSFTLTNIDASHAGNYDVLVTNAVGKVLSAVAKLSVNTTPIIVSQPKSLAASIGSSASFKVSATGVAPLRYQWRRFGTNIPGALSAELRLSDLKPTHAGPYEVLVSNRLGESLSESASLTILEKLLTTARASDNSLQIHLIGETGKQYALESSTNLSNWLTLTNSSPTNANLIYLDLISRSIPRKFYRARAF